MDDPTLVEVARRIQPHMAWFGKPYDLHYWGSHWRTVQAVLVVENDDWALMVSSEAEWFLAQKLITVAAHHVRYGLRGNGEPASQTEILLVFTLPTILAGVNRFCEMVRDRYGLLETEAAALHVFVTRRLGPIVIDETSAS